MIGHNWRSKLDAVEKGPGISVHGQVPRFVIDINYVCKKSQGGVGNQNVKFSEPLFDPFKDSRSLIVIAHISPVGIAIDAIAFYFFNGFVGRLARAKVVDDYMGSLLGQFLGHAPSNSFGTSRNKGDFSF